MASPLRVEDPSLAAAQPDLEALLRDEPWCLEFFQAVRLLTRIHPGEPVGRFARPEQEAVHFGVSTPLAFPASSIQSLDWPAEGPARMEVNFFGLTGPSGVLPRPYSELISQRERARDTGLLAFLDLFHHRLLSLFYQAWEKYRAPVSFERGEPDHLGEYLADLIGLGTPGLQNRLSIPDRTLLFYSGLLSLQPRSALALEQLLSDHFGVPVEVEQFVGGWFPLPLEDQCALEESLGFTGQLGVGATVGDEVWDQSSRVRVRLGPLTRVQYESFLPGGAAYVPLCEITRLFVGQGLSMEAQLVLHHAEVPACELGEEDAPTPLGWETWLKSGPHFARDPGDTVLPIA